MGITPLKTASTSLQPYILVVGNIIGESDGRVDIQIPSLSGSSVIKNIDYIDSGFDAKPTKGEKVIIGFLEGIQDDPIVLGRLSSSMSPKTADRNDVIKDLKDRIETLENQIVSLTARIETLESHTH